MSALVSWVVAHEALVSGAAVALLDLAFALAPNLNANGLLHAVYLGLQKMAGKTPPAA